METRLAAWIADTAAGREADAILRSCVHCGFCLATCPTYQLLGDELDSPRGRIYQIKQVLEGAEPTRATQLHLDRCLTCRNCESTCPSGVQYGHLVDIGREVVAQRVHRSYRDRLLRWLLRETLTRPRLFAVGVRLGRSVARLLPRALRDKLPVSPAAGRWPTRSHSRKVLLLKGCVQPSLLPAIDAATARVLDALGIQVLVSGGSGCCGAIRQHLDDQGGALGNLRRNIDAWWPYVESGQVEAIIINASGCSAMVKDYGHLLRNDAAYAEKAQRIAGIARDLAEFLPAELARSSLPRPRTPARVAFHPPCTLQHGLKVRGAVEGVLRGWGAELAPVPDSHLCCGSAGTYSLLQPELSGQLRAAKLNALQSGAPEVILSANVGCITHLQSGTRTPVRHWIEWLDEHLA